MNSKPWIREALTLCMMVSMIATYSMVALAGTGQVAGELIVTGNNAGGEAPFVLVNGEAAKSGRTIFSSSTISTPDGSGAIVNLNRAGKIELAPKTTLQLSFDDSSISGELTSGSVKVLNAAQIVNIKTSTGDAVELNAGETASAEAGKTVDDDYKNADGKCIDADQDSKEECDNSKAWWVWALVFGGAIAGVVLAAKNGNEPAIGGGTSIVSPSR